jgi:AcrR family transcriptional regulator
MGYDSAATRKRLLDAAYAEFVERGLAGARVASIAEAAQANKQAIYLYFGSKEGLFDAVLVNRLGLIADAVPFTPHDLPGFAAAIFDYLQAHPGHMRLNMWKRLERDHAAAEEIAANQYKADHLAQALDFTDSPATPLDLVLIVLNIAYTWSTYPPDLRAVAGIPDATRTAQHRAAVTATVTAALQALTNPAGNDVHPIDPPAPEPPRARRGQGKRGAVGR